MFRVTCTRHDCVFEGQAENRAAAELLAGAHEKATGHEMKLEAE